MADEFILVPVADPMIGMVIRNTFVITQLLGRGGMGAVYLAQHKAAAHIRLVYKTILAHLSNNALIIDRFNVEAQAVGRLVGHENIVELKDVGVWPSGQMFMEFEYIGGIPLDRFLAEWGGRLSLHRALYLALQVCDALDFAHAMGVVHRDLKPENLLVVIQDHKRVPRLLKIVDFGISKVAGGGVHTISGMKMGTPYYMAVEQYANAAEAGPKSDVFSLAVIIWKMITGELPWGCHPEPGVLYHLQRTVVPTPPPVDIMPAAVARILLRCFLVDPDLRPTMRQLALDLAAVIPATDDAPSGGAILLHIVRRFLMESPELARTMPRSAMANPDDVAAQLWPPVNLAASPPAAVPAAPVPPQEAPPVAPPEADASITAHARPHALGATSASSSPAPSTPVRSPGAASSRPVAATPTEPGSSPPMAAPAALAVQDARGVPWPKIAEFSTGLISQRHLAQNPPTDVLAAMPRVRSLVAAAEIDLADGTPGPEPYAHAAVPRVVVSNTQLSRGERLHNSNPTPDVPTTQQMTGPEPPPVLVLSDVARSASRRKLLRIFAAAISMALLAVGIFAFLRLGSHASDAHGDGSRSVRGVGGVPDAGVAATESRSAPAVSPARQVDAGQLALSVDSGTGGPSAQDESRARETRMAVSASTDKATRNATTDSPRPPPATIPASSGEQASAKQPLQPPQPPGVKKGELAIEVDSWATIWLNGKQDEAPYRQMVPAGRYRLRIQHEEKDETMTVVVRSGATTTVKRNW